MANELQVNEDKSLDENEQGASLVEYALLVALIAVVCIAAITLLGQAASNKFSSIGGVLDNTAAAS